MHRTDCYTSYNKTESLGTTGDASPLRPRVLGGKKNVKKIETNIKTWQKKNFTVELQTSFPVEMFVPCCTESLISMLISTRFQISSSQIRSLHPHDSGSRLHLLHLHEAPFPRSSKSPTISAVLVFKSTHTISGMFVY